jgi:hypothetical protein
MLHKFQKPPVGAKIDWDHPWSQGLIAFWLFHEGTGLPIELVHNIFPTGSTAFLWGTNSAGRGGSFNGTNTNLTYSSVPAVGPVLSLAGYASTNTLTSSILIERSNVNATWEVLGPNGNPTTMNYRGGSTSNRGTMMLSSGALALNTIFGWCFSDAGLSAVTSVSCYFNGSPVSNTATGTATIAQSNTNAIHLGNYDAGGYYFNGIQNWIGLWNYAIPSSMACPMTASPNAIYQIFRPQGGLVYRTFKSFRRTIVQRIGSRGVA